MLPNPDGVSRVAPGTVSATRGISIKIEPNPERGWPMLIPLAIQVTLRSSD